MTGEMRRAAGFWLAVVFVMGGAIGGVFGYAFAHKSYASTNVMTLSEPERRAKRVEDMTKDIGLTAEQAQKVDAMLLKAHTDIKQIHDRAETEIDVIRQTKRAEMRTFLTDEQKPKFEAFVQKIDEERKRLAQGK
jgi:Spy/CpxP family protein refolding chaperone